MSWYTDYSLAQMEAMMDWLYQQSQGGGSSTSLIHQASRTLDNAAIQALPSSIELVPAPGVGRYLVFILGTLNKNFAGAYGNNLNTAIYFVYDTISDFDQASLISADTQADAFLVNANVRQYVYPPFASISTTATIGPTGSNLQNTNIGFTIDNSGGAFTGGNAANTLLVAVEFRVVDVTLGRFLTTEESGWDEDTRTFA